MCKLQEYIYNILIDDWNNEWNTTVFFYLCTNLFEYEYSTLCHSICLSLSLIFSIAMLHGLCLSWKKTNGRAKYADIYKYHNMNHDYFLLIIIYFILFWLLSWIQLKMCVCVSDFLNHKNARTMIFMLDCTVDRSIEEPV